MTDLAQKIAAMLVDKGYVMPHEQYEAAHAIRTALPVAQGEAVGYYWYDVAGERQFDWVKPDEWTQRTCAVMPVYESPPASRIAELEREVERLREAVDSEKLFSSQALDAVEEISIDRDRLLKMLDVLDVLTPQECSLIKVTAENLQCSQSQLLGARVAALAAQEKNDGRN